MKKLLLILLLVTISYQISRGKLRSNANAKTKQDYVEETRQPHEFKKAKYCKFRKCIKSKEAEQEMNKNAKDGGEDSKQFQQFQQKCFYTCQIEHCKAKKKNQDKCKKDENGIEYKPIFDNQDAEFRNYGPTQKELDDYLVVDDDKIIKGYRDKHYPQQ